MAAASKPGFPEKTQPEPLVILWDQHDGREPPEKSSLKGTPTAAHGVVKVTGPTKELVPLAPQSPWI